MGPGPTPVNRFTDRLLGYWLLCRLCRRLLFVIPPKLSDLLELSWRGDESLELYMASLGFELATDAFSATHRRPQTFRELQMSAEANPAPTEPPAPVFRKVNPNPRKNVATVDIKNLQITQNGGTALRGQRPVVFLDIDDVLCIHRNFNTRHVLAALTGDEGVDADEVWQQIFHRHAVENLRELDDEFRPWYVVSSSWTLHLTREQLCAAFVATGLSFVADNLHKHWCTPRDDDSYRLVEIDAWLDLHAWRGTQLLAPAPFLIIDDELSGQSLVGSHVEQRTVLCDASTGFLYPQLRAARKILGTSQERNDGS